MANEVTKTNVFGTVQIKGGEEAMKAALATSGSIGALGMAPDGSQYLNFSGKQGRYSFGKDAEDLENDEIWVVNSMSFEIGWACWKNSQKLASRMASIYSDNQVPDPDFAEHGPFKQGEGWQRAKAMVVKSIDEDNRQGYFNTNSKTGVGAISGLQQEIVERLNTGAPSWPLIQFDREKFTAQGNINHKPILRVYGWLTYDALVELSNDPDISLTELIAKSANTPPPAAPKAPAKQVKAPEPEPEPEEEEAIEPEVVTPAPTERRRRRPTL